MKIHTMKIHPINPLKVVFLTAVTCFGHQAWSVSGTVNYEYDFQGRLKTGSYTNSASLGYTYDTEGNRQLVGVASVLVDTDSDGIPDSVDNCPAFSSAYQANSDGDFQGDICQLSLNSDQDKLLDSWEMANFGSLGTSNGTGDADADGLTDENEFLAGTNPNWAFHVISDYVIIEKNQTVDIPVPVLLANDFNPNSWILSISNVLKTGAGTPSLPGDVRFVPLNGSLAADKFQYTAIRTDYATPTGSGDVNVTIVDTGQPMNGTDASEIIFGGAGGSTINPAGGDDIIYGKNGTNKLDTVQIGKNEGQDYVYLNDPGSNDILSMKSDVAANDVGLDYIGDDLLVSMTGSSGDVLIGDVFSDYKSHMFKEIRYTGAASTVDQQSAMAVADHIVVSAPACSAGGYTCSDASREYFTFIPGDLLSNDFSILSESGAVVTTGITASNVTYGPVYSGNGCWFTDCFSLKSGNYGNPVVVQYQFTDGGEVNGRASATFSYVTGNTFSGSDKNDLIYGRNDTVDTLDGGLGNDDIRGQGENDTILFGLGDGKDNAQILDWYQSADKIALKNTLTWNNIVFQRVGIALVIRTIDGSDSVTLDYYFANSSVANLAQFDRVQFLDGSHADVLTSAIPALATFGATLQGTSGADNPLAGTTGNDVIFGWDGNDLIQGSSGNDWIYGGNGNDTLQSGVGNDHLYGDDGVDSFWGASATSTVSYWGGGGVDQYGVGPTYGQITIDNLDTTTNRSDPCTGNCQTPLDHVWFVQGVSESQVTFRRSGSDVIFETTNGTQTSTTTLLEYLGNEHSELDFRFKDVTSSGVNPVVWDGSCIDYYETNAVVDEDDLLALDAAGTLVDSNSDGAPDLARLNYNTARTGKVPGCMKNRVVRDMVTTGNDVITGYTVGDWINASDGNDTVYADDGNDVVYGGAGNDTLDGSWGNDRLKGQDGDDHLYPGQWGNDELIGGEGADSYYISIDSSVVTITDQDATGTELDAIRFFDGVTANQLWFYMDNLDGGGSNNDLVIQRINLPGNKVIIPNWCSNAADCQNTIAATNRIESFYAGTGSNCKKLDYSQFPSMTVGGSSILRLKTDPPTQDFTAAPYWASCP